MAETKTGGTARLPGANAWDNRMPEHIKESAEPSGGDGGRAKKAVSARTVATRRLEEGRGTDD
ncbi:MAG TPA: hypothetical protein VIM86_13395 [Thermodesulfobacteriota bacterium]